MNYSAARLAGVLGLTLILALAGIADAGVNAFWQELGGSASDGGISKLGANVSADSARVAFGPDNLPVVTYIVRPTETDPPGTVFVRRWTGTAWQDLSPGVTGSEPRIAIAPNGTRFVSWLQDDGSGPQVHLLQRTASGTSWTLLGSMNSSAVTALTTSVNSHALAVGTDNLPVVAFGTTAQTGLFPFNEGVLQGTGQIYALKFNGLTWQYLGGDPSGTDGFNGGGASSAVSIFVDGTNYATHQATDVALTLVNNRPTVAFLYFTDYTSGNGSAPIEFIPGNTEIFVTQFNTNTSTWVAVGPAVPQSDDGGAARGGLGGASSLPGTSLNPSIASRDGATPTIALTWLESDTSGPTPTHTIYTRLFNGAAWVPPGVSGSDVVAETFQNSMAHVAVTADRRAVVAWDFFDGTLEQVFVKRSGPLGFEEMGPDSADGPGISDSPTFAFFPSIAAPASGGPAVAWLNDATPADEAQVFLRQFSNAAPFTLTVLRTGAGANTSSVTSSPIGIDCPSDSCSAIFPSGQAVLLTPVAGAHAKFNTWAGCTSVSGNVCTVAMTSNKTVTANFVAANTVSVTRLGNGGVLVSSTPAGINCGPGAATDCSETFTAGTSVMLNATVPTGSVFGSWGGDCAFRLKNLSCPLGVITGDRNVTVSSTLQFFTVKVNVTAPAGATGQGNVSDLNDDISCDVGNLNTCTEQEQFGSQVRLLAVAGTGSRFLGYTGTICNGSLNTSCIFTVSQNQTINASFRAVTQLFASTTGNGAGRAGNRISFAGDGFAGSSIDCGRSATGALLSDCTGEAFTNTSVTFTAMVATGSNLDPAGGACTWTGSGTTRTCSFIASGLNQSVTGNFVQEKRHLHVNGRINGIVAPGTSVFTTSNPGGIDCGNAGFGHDACDADFDFGTSVFLTPFADANTDFVGWTGCSSVNQSICRVDMTANATVLKTFNAVRTLNIAGTGNGNGVFTIAGSTPFNYLGTDASVARRIFTGTTASPTKTLVTPTASPGSNFTWLSSDFGCTGSAACTATMNNNHSALGRFLLNRHRIDIVRRLNGSVTGVFPPGTFDCGSGVTSTDCTETFDFGTQVHLFASPDDGFVFDHWEGVTCSGGQTNASCAFKVPDTNLSIAPFYRAHTFVSVTKDGNGKGILSATTVAPGLLKPAAPTCGESCPALNFDAFNGRPVTLRATASIGSRFDGFSGDCTSSTATCTYTPSGNNDSVTATFTLRQFLISVTNNPNGSVTNVNALVDPIDCGGGDTDCFSTLNFGTQVVLRAAPLDGFVFNTWAGTFCNGSSNATCAFVVPNTNVSLSPSYRRATLVNVTRVGTGSGKVVSTPAGINCGGTPSDCSELFFGGTPVRFDATPATGSQFDGFSGISCSSNSSSCTFTPTGSVQGINASFTLRQFVISVFNNPNGSVVSTSPLGGVIDCGAGGLNCETTQNFGQLVNLTTDPNVGFVFNGWVTTPAGLCSNTNATCSFKVPATNVTVRANFRLRTLVSVLRNGTGTGTVTSNPAGINCGTDCTETFFDGRSVMFTATTPAGNVFAGFSGACVSNTSTCTYIPSGDSQTVIATFDKAPAVVNLTVNGDGSVTRGADSCDPSDGVCSFPGLFGETVTFVAHPNAPNRLVSFTGCTSMTNASFCNVTQAGTKNVTATFSFSVTTSKFGDGTGTVTPSPAGTSCGAGCTSYTPGTVVTLTEAPGSGSAFGGWDDDCSFRGTNTTCALTMNQNRVVSAGFFRPVTLIVNRNGAGTGTVTSNPAGINCGSDCTQAYSFGTLVTLTANAASGSAFAGFTGCDSLVGNTSCRVSMTSNRTVDATFTPPVTTLNVSVQGNGSVTGPGISCGIGNSGDCFEAYTPGTQVTLVASPDVGFFLNAFASPCSSANTSCTFLMNVNRAIGAQFLPAAALNLTFTGAGTGTVSFTNALPDSGTSCDSSAPCTAYFVPGTLVALTATASSGTFGEWTGDCFGTPSNESCVLVVSGNRSVGASFVLDPVTAHVLGDANIAIAGAGGVCSAPCDRIFERGTEVVFTEIESPGKIFTGWGFDCAFAGNSSTCDLMLTSDKTITTTSVVQFNAITVLFDGSGDGAGSISLTGSSHSGTCNYPGDFPGCTFLFDPGEVVDVTAPGVSSFSDDCPNLANQTADSFQTTLTQDCKVQGTFFVAN